MKFDRKPKTANEVTNQLGEIIGKVDLDLLDLSRSRVLEQEVLDLIDHESASRRNFSSSAK